MSTIFLGISIIILIIGIINEKEKLIKKFDKKLELLNEITIARQKDFNEINEACSKNFEIIEQDIMRINNQIKELQNKINNDNTSM